MTDAPGTPPTDDEAFDSDPALDATVELLTRAQQGDAEAVNLLFSRYLPPLRRWARGRLPQYARDLPNVRSYPDGYDVRDLGTFAPRGPGRMSGCPNQPPA